MDDLRRMQQEHGHRDSPVLEVNTLRIITAAHREKNHMAKLTGAEVENFRSIAKLKIDFTHGCQALIGVNESGKSNILRALQLLDPEVKPTPADLRMDRQGEPRVTVGNVRFFLELSELEIQSLVRSLQAHIEPKSRAGTVARLGERELTLNELCCELGCGYLEVQIPSGARSAACWRPSEDLVLEGKWLRNATDHGQPFAHPGSSEQTTVPPQGFVRTWPGHSAPDFNEISVLEIYQLVAPLVQSLLSTNHPKVVLWKYGPEYLLPSSINVNEFANNPNSCIPLKSMFELADIKGDDLRRGILETKNADLHRYHRMLDRVGEAATQHVASIWSDHRTVKLQVRPNGELLVPTVIDRDVGLDMGSRSDGFKRFVSFLLNISAKVKTQELVNTLLLIDEPEVGLHPKGARSLMEELIEIGKTNAVVYCTHSIFMVDRSNVDRHLIVEKKKEVTEARRAERSRIQDEEVLYAAMGYSVFETLRKANVIFEGWRDKEVFRVAGDRMAKSDKTIASRLNAIGLTFAEGVKDVVNVGRFLELAGRNYLIISDADTPALEKRKAFRPSSSSGVWKTLKDVFPGFGIETAEDLIDRNALVKRLAALSKSFPNLQRLDLASFSPNEPALTTLKKWIASSGYVGDTVKTVLDEAKELIFAELRRDDVIPEADRLVELVLKHDFQAPSS